MKDVSATAEVQLLVDYLEATRLESSHHEIRKDGRSVWIDKALEAALSSRTRDEFEWHVITLRNGYTIHRGEYKDWRKIPRLVRALSGGGECGEIIRTKDWTKTPLGPISSWPGELIGAISQLLSCELPLAIHWGPDHHMFYNDAYAPITQGKHPEIYGWKCRDSWSDIWEVIKVIYGDAYTGACLTAVDQLFWMWRADQKLLKEAYISWSLPQLRDADGRIVGLLNPCFDNTVRVVRTRRDRLIEALAYASDGLRSNQALLKVFLDHVKDAVIDIPFCIIFTRASTLEICSIDWEFLDSCGNFDAKVGCDPKTWAASLPAKFSEEEHMTVQRVNVPAGFCSHQVEGLPKSQDVRYAAVVQYAPDCYCVFGVPPTDSSWDNYSQFILSMMRLERSLQKQIEFQDLEVKRAQNEISVQAERQLRHEAEEYRRRSEAFIDMVCHEIRNPINSILHTSAYVCDILETPLPDYEAENTQIRETRRADIIDSVKTIINCATHQHRVANDVLEASKIDMDKMELISVPMRPSNVVNALFKQYRTELQEEEITTDFVVSDRAKDLKIDYVLGDPQRLLQILINLLSNAIKFTKSVRSRHIEIHMDVQPIQDDDIWLHFSVRDSGIGLTSEEQQTLFERFSQASSKTFNSYGGSGLGLYISKRLVEMQKGRISIYSDPKVAAGTQLNFYIASQTCPPPIKPVSSERKPTRDLNPLNILILEDNPINRKVLTRIVESLGHRVVTGNDGLQGLTRMKGEYFDIVLCDCEMPNMDGLEFARRVRRFERSSGSTTEGSTLSTRPISQNDDRNVRQSTDHTDTSNGTNDDTEGLFPRHQKVPIIAVTGNVREQQVRAALDAGMDSHIAKPYSREDIQSVLESVRVSPK